MLIIGGSLMSYWNIPSKVSCESRKGPMGALNFLKSFDFKYFRRLAKERVAASNLYASFSHIRSKERFMHMN